MENKSVAWAKKINTGGMSLNNERLPLATNVKALVSVWASRPRSSV